MIVTAADYQRQLKTHIDDMVARTDRLLVGGGVTSMEQYQVLCAERKLLHRLLDTMDAITRIHGPSGEINNAE